MKRYLLDTNVISELRKQRPHGAVVAWVDSVPNEQLYVSAATIGELQRGVEKTRRQDPSKSLQIESWIDQFARDSQVISMDGHCFREWGRLMHGKSDDLPEDAMIAATARVHNLVLATRNEADFKHFDVELFNPFKFPKPS